MYDTGEVAGELYSVERVVISKVRIVMLWNKLNEIIHARKTSCFNAL